MALASRVFATNLVTNGDFANGVAGWTTNGSSVSFANNTITVTANGTQPFGLAVHNTALVPSVGKKIYLKCKARMRTFTASNMSIQIGGTSGGANLDTPAISSPVPDSWYTISGIITLTDQTGFLQIKLVQRHADTATANGKVMEAQEVLAIDLTTMFGSLKEPDKATCDQLFSTWLDGTESLPKLMPRTKGVSPSEATIRALPNGVVDQVVNGEYVKNVEVSTFNGTESWAVNGAYPNQATSIVFALSLPKAISNWTVQKSTCDKLTWKDNLAIWNNDNAIGYNIDGSPSLIVRIERVNLSTADVAGFKAWLSQNPITLTYQLASPTVTPITPRVVKPNVSNLVINGNFASGVAGWSGANSSLAVSNNVLTSIGTGVGTGVYPHRVLGSWALNKKIYNRVIMRVTNSACTILQLQNFSNGMTPSNTITCAQVNNPVQNQWYTLSGITTLTSGLSTSNYNIQIRHGYVDSASSNGQGAEIREALSIDLTETFGSGKEPDLQTCNTLFANWFDGAVCLPSLGKKAVTEPTSLMPHITGIVNGVINSVTGTQSGSTQRICTQNFVTVKSATKYTILTGSTFQITAHEYDDNNAWIKETGWQTNYTFTTTQATKKIKLSLSYKDNRVLTPVDYPAMQALLYETDLPKVNKSATDLVNLWATAGKPTSYSPLPLSPSHPGIYIQAMSYKLTFKAKSNSGAVIRAFDLWTAQYGTSLVRDFQLTSDMTQYTITWVETNPSNMVYLSDKNSIGDIIVQDIKLTQVR